MRRVVVDVDVGSDDFLALLILLDGEKNGKIKIEAIVCSMGNASVENVCKNVVRLLELVGRTDIPVYRGASLQLIKPQFALKLFHGSDGFGDLRHDKEPDLSIIRKEPAAVAVANLVLKRPNEITLICVGPLTNLALSIRLYEDFAPSIKDLWIMGGNYTAVGNVTPTAEYNFYVDPEAVHIALSSVEKPIYLLTWETCLLPKISMHWRYEVFGAKNKAAIQLLTRAEKSIYDGKEKFWLPCDAFLAAAFVYPTIIARKSTHHASIELHGSQTRGQIVLDHLKINKPNVTIIEEVDPEQFKKILLEL